MDTTIKDFEAAIAELEIIVKKLEDGDLALEKSLELYERGVQLSRFCHARLEDAERRIEILNDRGELKPAPPALGIAERSGSLSSCPSTSTCRPAEPRSRRRWNGGRLPRRRPRLSSRTPCATA